MEIVKWGVFKFSFEVWRLRVSCIPLILLVRVVFIFLLKWKMYTLNFESLRLTLYMYYHLRKMSNFNKKGWLVFFHMWHIWLKWRPIEFRLFISFRMKASLAGLDHRDGPFTWPMRSFMFKVQLRLDLTQDTTQKGSTLITLTNFIRLSWFAFCFVGLLSNVKLALTWIWFCLSLQVK